MALKRTRAVLGAALTLMTLAIPMSTPAHPAFAQQAPNAQPAASIDASFSVTNPIGEYTLQPGASVTHTVVVGLGSAATEAVDVQADAVGLGQGLDGATIPLSAEQDKSPQSARTFMTVEPTSFTLQPGGSRTVTATIYLPPSAERPFYYGDLYVHTAPTGSQRIGIIRAAHVPIILTVEGGETKDEGSISDLTVEPPQAGEPLHLTAVLENHGEHHYKANATFDIRSDGGQSLASQAAAFRGSSLLPTFSRSFAASFSFLDRPQGLPVGDYIARVQFVVPGGRALATRETRFHLSEPYLPFPGIDPAHMKVVQFHDEEPGVVDARAEADVLLRFSNTGKVTGTLVVGRFNAEPRGVPLSIGEIDGGLGKDGLKFVGIGVQGFSQGNVNVNVFYRDDELQNLDPSSLLVGLRAGLQGHWARLDNLVSQTGTKAVAGDTTVLTLNSAPVFGVGGDLKSSLASLPIALWLGLAVGLVVVAGSSGFLFARRRAARSGSEDDEDDAED